MIVKINGAIRPSDTLTKIADDYFHYGEHTIDPTPIGNALNTFDCMDRFNDVVMHQTEVTGVIYDTICSVADGIGNLLGF